MSDEQMIIKRPVPRDVEEYEAEEYGAAPTERTEEADAPSEPLELHISVKRVKIGDIRAIDNMGTGQPGAFAKGVDVLEHYIQNEDFDINELDFDQLSTIARMVSEEIGRFVDRKNSRGASRRR